MKMPNNSKNQINIDNNINKVPFDNIAKQNLATYINKYICDTIYILQIQINSILSGRQNNSPSMNNLKNEKENICDEINVIKKINNSLEKELFYLNNAKKEETSKFINILCKRNELLNLLMFHYFEKEKLLEKREQILNEKIKSFSYSLNKRKSWYQINKITKEGKKIDHYMENIKKHNEYYNNKRLSKYLNTHDNDRIKEINNINNRKKTKNKSLLNKSYDAISINNIDTSCSFNNINFDVDNTNCDFKKMKNFQKRNSEYKLKLRKINSVSSMINKSSIINYFNRNTYIKLKDKVQLSKLNLEKLNNITSNIYLLKQAK
jgi:hypothetical protein